MKSTLQAMADKVLLFSLPVAILGAIFKIMHYAGGNYMLLIGLSSTALGAFMKNAFEGTLESFITGTTIAVWCIAVLFKIMHWPYGGLLVKAGFVALAIWAINYFFRQNSSEE